MSTLKQQIGDIIINTIKLCNGNESEAARKLQISRLTVRKYHALYNRDQPIRSKFCPSLKNLEMIE